MCKSTYTKRFAAPSHQRRSRCELLDIRTYAQRVTALMTAESKRNHANAFELIAALYNTCAANQGKRQWQIQKRLNEVSSRL